jgi:hypothetical protein
MPVGALVARPLQYQVDPLATGYLECGTIRTGPGHLDPQHLSILRFHAEQRMAWQATGVAGEDIQHPAVGDDQQWADAPLLKCRRCDVGHRRQYPIGKGHHVLTTCKVGSRTAFENLLQQDRIELGQLTFGNALDDTEVTFLEGSPRSAAMISAVSIARISGLDQTAAKWCGASCRASSCAWARPASLIGTSLQPCRMPATFQSVSP